jgi:hypothetical protein
LLLLLCEVLQQLRSIEDQYLTRLTNLHSLMGEGVCMRPSSLAKLTWLRELHLCTKSHNSDGSKWVPRELLSALQPLTQLQYLGVRECNLYGIVPEPPRLAWQQPQDDCQSLAWQQSQEDCGCFSALTASTQLTCLSLYEHHHMPLPRAAFDHMFPAGRVLPHLKQLFLCTRSKSIFYDMGCRGFQHCVDAEQAARIAAGCPALQELRLFSVTSRSFDVNCLLQLPAAVTEVGLSWRRPSPQEAGSQADCTAQAPGHQLTQ